MTKLRDKTGAKTLLLVLVMALGVTALIAVSANATTTTGGSPLPVPTSTPVPPPPYTPEQPTVTETVTVDPSPTPAPQQPTVTTTVIPPPPPAPRTTPRPIPPPSTQQQEPSIGDDPILMSDADIRTKVASAFSVADQYWINLFTPWKDDQGNPVAWQTPMLYNNDGFYDSARGQVSPQCGDSPPLTDNAAFCGSVYTGTGFVHWDMEFFRKKSMLGDAAIYMIVAHEFGHAAQARFIHDHEDEAVLDDWDGEIELQADCIGGATLARAEHDGYLTRDPGGMEEMTDVSMHSGSYTDLSHGTPEQRDEWFKRGYQSADIESCLGNK